MRKIKILAVILTLSYASIMMLFRLDNPYMFTDEILYVQAGQEYKKMDYTLNLQHPLLGKYLSAITSGEDEKNVFLLRLPFAILGVFSSMIVFATIKREMGFWWGVIGSFIFISMPFLFSTYRSALLESPMHFFWLVFSYFILTYFKERRKKQYYLAGIALGLAMSVKFTSMILIPAFLLTDLLSQYLVSKKFTLCLKDYFPFFLLSLGTFILHYSHLVMVAGLEGLKNVARAFKDVILIRNSEGKIHIVDNKIFDRSPWWFYLYYVEKAYGVVRTAAVGTLSVLGFRDFSVYSIYWLSIFVSGVVYMQLLTLKNSRYIASLELPLVFLLILGLRWIYKKAGIAPVLVISFAIIFPTVKNLAIMVPDSYHGAYLKISRETSNFSNEDRTLIFGSVRSARWYFDGHPDTVVVRKDLDPLQNELFDFKYIMVDSAERLKFPTNVLFKHLDTYSDRYDVQKFDNVILYVLKDK